MTQISKDEIVAQMRANRGPPRTLPHCKGHPNPCSMHDASVPKQRFFDGGLCHDRDEFDELAEPDRIPRNYEIISGCHRCYLAEIGRGFPIIVRCAHGWEVTEVLPRQL